MNGFSFKFSGIDLNMIVQGFADAPKHPTAIFSIIGLIILAIIFLKVRKVKLSTTAITNIGVALALGTVLKMVKFYQAPMGGSATLGSMVPIFIIALFYGSYAPKGMSAVYYSFVYNLGYLAPDAILCIVVLTIIPLKQIFSIMNKQTAGIIN